MLNQDLNLKKIIQQQNPQWRTGFKLEKFTERELVKKIKLDSKFIEIITGVRRSGKSVILKILLQKLIEEKKINPREILFLNLDYPHFIPVYENSTHLDKLVSQAEELTGRKIKYLFLDEIQNVQNWEKWVKAVYDEKIFKKIFLTGSNADLLNSRNITRLSGRYFAHFNLPFSFKEFLQARKKKFYSNLIDNLNIRHQLLKEFDKYLRLGGFPEVVMENNPEILNSYYQTILQKDVLTEIDTKNTLPLQELAYWLITNFTSLFTYNKLGHLLGIDEMTVRRYIQLLQDVFLMFDLKKFDPSLRKQARNPKKIYLVDNGLAYQIGFNFTENKGSYFENLVFLNLLKHQSEIFYHQENKKECDFIIKQGLKVIAAYQACYELSAENKEREIAGLINALEKYQLSVGRIITRDQEETIKIGNKKIEIIPAWQWLLSEDKLLEK